MPGAEPPTGPLERIARDEAAARQRLDPAVHGYFAGGAGREQTLDEVEPQWRALWLRPRVLRDVREVSTAVTLLGETLTAPVVLAPVAACGLVHPEGECAAARAAQAAGTVFCMPTRATRDLAEVAAAAPTGARWFQLYVAADRELTARVLARAAAAGYSRIVLTVDLPVGAWRPREAGTPLALAPGIAIADHLGEPAHPADAPARVKPLAGGWDAGLTWSDVAWVAETAGLPVIVKGILTGEDARLAVEHGAEAVVVSNHGARQLDGAVPAAVALEEVVGVVGGRIAVLVDGGIRCGADIARALALGADAVMIGRPWLWALAAGGEEEITALLEALRDDLSRTLALLGCRSPAELGREHVRRSTPPLG